MEVYCLCFSTELYFVMWKSSEQEINLLNLLACRNYSHELTGVVEDTQ